MDVYAGLLRVDDSVIEILHQTQQASLPTPNEALRFSLMREDARSCERLLFERVST